MSQNFGDVQIVGTADVVQLGVKGNATQTNAIQLWQDSGSNPLARVTGDGRFQIGNNIVSGPTDALIQANYNPTGAMPTSVWHAPGVLTASGTLAGTVNWVFHELQLSGSVILNGIQNALYTKLTNATTGNAGSADLRAATFQVISSGGSGATPVAKATGARLVASNSSSAYLSQATGIEATISNDTGGSITSATAFSVAAPTNTGTISTLYGLQMADLIQGAANYALYTGKGTVHLGDLFEIPVFSATPAGIPPANFIQVYTKLLSGTAQLYAKNSSGVESLLGGTGSGNVTNVGLTMPSSVFSVTGSPVTSSGTFSVTLTNQTANTVLAGPASGGAAVPSFRALAAADLTSALASPPAIGATTPATGTFTTLTATVQANVTGAAGTNRATFYQTNGSNRWFVGAGADAESGGTVGSNFYISRSNDSGTFIDSSFEIVRSTGNAIFFHGLQATGGIDNTSIGSITPATGTFTTLTATNQVDITGASGATRAVYYQTNGVNRWYAGVGSDPETGGTTGSNFYIYRMNDSGAIINGALQIYRNTGNAIFYNGLQAVGGIDNTVIGLATPNLGYFTTLTAYGTVTTPHLVGYPASTPTIAAGQATSVSLSATSTDLAGKITFTPSGAAGYGTVVTINFHAAYATRPTAVLLTPANSNSASLAANTVPFVPSSNLATTSFNLVYAGLTPGTITVPYEFYYMVIG